MQISVQQKDVRVLKTVITSRLVIFLGYFLTKFFHIAPLIAVTSCVTPKDGIFPPTNTEYETFSCSFFAVDRADLCSVFLSY